MTQSDKKIPVMFEKSKKALDMLEELWAESRRVRFSENTWLTLNEIRENMNLPPLQHRPDLSTRCTRHQLRIPARQIGRTLRRSEEFRQMMSRPRQRIKGTESLTDEDLDQLMETLRNQSYSIY